MESYELDLLFLALIERLRASSERRSPRADLLSKQFDMSKQSLELLNETQDPDQVCTLLRDNGRGLAGVIRRCWNSGREV